MQTSVEQIKRSPTKIDLHLDESSDVSDYAELLVSA
jgi:hypothetical protein